MAQALPQASVAVVAEAMPVSTRVGAAEAVQGSKHRGTGSVQTAEYVEGFAYIRFRMGTGLKACGRWCRPWLGYSGSLGVR